MAETIAPKSAEELANIIAGRNAPVEIVGTGTKRGLGRPLSGLTPLSMKAFTGISLYDPAELIIEASAATPLAEVERTLAAKNQQLAFEPPAGGTVGGAVACNLSGPRRVKAGALRDHLLMVEGVSGRGEIFKAGARVVKNVTGYDLPKLMAGSYGTLTALTSVTLKVMPKPESEATLVVPDQSIAAAVATMTAALQSPNEVSGAAHLPGTGTLLRLEGIAASVAFRLARLRDMFPSAKPADTSPWAAVRDYHGKEGEILWRISLPPLATTAYLAALREKLAFDAMLDWGGGLIWLVCKAASDGHAATIRSLLPSGHATLAAAPPDVRARVPVFHPQPPALAALTRKVKEAYDPKGILNPGRMYEGL